MPVTPDQPAPYAPATAILDLIERHRNRGLPAIVDAEVLLRAGVSDSLVPRTLQALRTLDLLEDDGRPSAVFEGIRLAPTAEYQQRLTEWLNAAYAEALTFIDPATDDEVRIRDAFRSYIPTGQQSRMVSLFSGLFTAAGVMPTRQKQASPRKTPPIGNGNARPARPVAQNSAVHRSSKPAAQHVPASGMPPALAGLMASLPAEGEGWTRESRDRFSATFTAVLDFCFPIVAPATNTATDQ